jgi:hypothetical protein
VLLRDAFAWLTARARGPIAWRSRNAVVVVVAVAVAAFGLAFAPGSARAQAPPPQEPDFEKLPFAPQRAIVYRAASPLTIDGKLDEASWRAAGWSDAFVDIQGLESLRPRFRTRVKMLWDDDYFYVAADLDEPDIWGTLKERDSVIFRDNDFELFIDPDGDTHNYYELEVNALGTPWDLLLPQPYRDGGTAIHAWDIAGLRVGVDVRGTLNKPGDIDQGWSIEIAMPWKILREAARERRAPRAGEQWRVNFSRVEWQTDVKDGGYVKRVDAKTGKNLPEDNWVWSPQGAINMHMPERWGFVQFSDALATPATPAATGAAAGAGPAAGASPAANASPGASAGAGAGATSATFVEDPNERVKWALRRLYYRQRRFRAAAANGGKYATDLAALDAGSISVEGLTFKPVMQATDALYEIAAPGFNGMLVHIRQDGKTWLTK